MKTLLILLALPLLALPFVQEQEHAEHEETPLEEQMLLLEENLGKLRRSLRDEAKTDESLAALLAMQAATMRSKVLVPEMAAEIPEAEREAFVADFRKTLIDLLREQLALEVALIDGDREEAKAIFKRIRATEESGHEKFTHEEEE